MRTFVQGVQGGVRNVNFFCDQIKGKEHHKCWRSGEGTYKTAEVSNGVHVHEHRRSRWGIRTVNHSGNSTKATTEIWVKYWQKYTKP